MRERSDEFPRLWEFRSTTTGYKREVLVGGTRFSCAVLTLPARLAIRETKFCCYSGWSKVSHRARSSVALEIFVLDLKNYS